MLIGNKIKRSVVIMGCLVSITSHAGGLWGIAGKMAIESTLSHDSSRSSTHTLTVNNAIKGSAYIAYVIDGDTLWVSVEREQFEQFWSVADTDDKKNALRPKSMQVKMRIGGIDTAESEHRNTSKNTAAGKVASNYLKQWASKKGAYYSCYDHDVYYGRPICAVNIDGKDIGYEMIKKGHSKYVTKWSTHPYYDKEYRQADATN